MPHKEPLQETPVQREPVQIPGQVPVSAQDALPSTEDTENTGDTGSASHILSLAFDLPEAVQYIAHLRRTALCFLEGMGVSRDDANDVELLLGELATNAVRHARGGSYHVDLDLFKDRAVVTVRDNGIGFATEKLSPPGVRPFDLIHTEGEERIGGFGLPLVHSIADRVDIQPNLPQGTVVRAEKRFH